MNRDEFMKELEYLLQDVPDEEKTDALDYYRDYLEESGEDEENAIKEFGSPERIAAIIRADIAGHLEEGGGFTDCGYEDERFRDPNYQMAKRYDLPEAGSPANSTGQEKASSRTGNAGRNGSPWTNTPLKVILWIILILITFPIWIGIGSGLFGLLCGVIAVLGVVLVILPILAVAFLIAGVAGGVAGVIHMMVNPLGGALAVGISCLSLGAALLFLLGTVLLYGKFLPWIFRGLIDGVSRLFHRRGGAQ